MNKNLSFMTMLVMLFAIPTHALAAKCQDKLPPGVYFSDGIDDENSPRQLTGSVCMTVTNPGAVGDFDMAVAFSSGDVYDVSCSCNPLGAAGKIKVDESKQFTCVGSKVGEPTVLIAFAGGSTGNTSKPRMGRLRYLFQDGSTGLLRRSTLAEPGDCA